MKKNRAILIVFCLIFAFSFLACGETEAATKKTKILIVPGHEPYYGGTTYKNLKEYELNVIMAKKIVALLKKNKKIDVTLLHDGNTWNKDLQKYVSKNKKNIDAWVESKKDMMVQAIESGEMTKTDNVPHNNIIARLKTRLYGINKWADEKKFDIVVNVHFNDNPRSNGNPSYSGYVVYIPEKQYGNAAASRKLGTAIDKNLRTIKKPSTLPEESAGLVEDQNLIALGYANSLTMPSVLIEYAYIYEPFMQKKKTRDAYFTKAAQKTVLGINEYLKIK